MPGLRFIRSSQYLTVIAGFLTVAGGALAEDRAAEKDNAVLTDAIRIEVPPGRLDQCAPRVAWAFQLPGPEAGFGPVLPEVPVGYGPSCAMIETGDPDRLGRVSSR